METKKVKIKDIYLDDSFYPRSKYNWHTAFVYSQNMLAGAKFPPIVLAEYNNKLYLVDGKHRMEANILLKNSEVDAIVHTGWSFKKIFEEAVKLNMEHGLTLTPYDKRRIAVRLMELEFDKKEISGLIQVPEEKLENFVGQRLVNSLSGKEITIEDAQNNAREIAQSILKTEIKQFAGQTFDVEDFEHLKKVQASLSGTSQRALFNNVNRLLANGLIDKTDKKLMETVRETLRLLKKL